MAKFEIEVGMSVFLYPTGNYRRMYTEALHEGTVTKIARKYFYVELTNKRITEKFDRETFVCYSNEHNAGWKIYPSAKGFLEEKTYEIKLKAIREIFGRYDFVPSPELVGTVYELLQKEILVPEKIQAGIEKMETADKQKET